mmetsp:Transcript_4960/g.7424  ORF Transcript_4960/g.7424 Transcript_4960/m.7424 type:complete len:153 (+) Transcript_4960:688-1146(+)|eukprot:CAMPEP_0170498538 /NCGR_PEP_ID=MMETSP0208-20121228/28105_1 /TAXON_ID=197538 /ORGANISM="Strombidium inclinatum, Strain S3" /LENGTH=152 /DNA_ID=CAMNT_0010775737 /DNA_START=613 /DNA_END=1071 /DNA_ORIENTATION=-
MPYVSDKQRKTDNNTTSVATLPQILQDSTKSERTADEQSSADAEPVSKKESSPEKKTFVDKYKKRLVRQFRAHLNAQFDEIYKRRHYRWIASSQRAAVQSFFLEQYNVPEDFYQKHEGVYVRLILNTLKNPSELGVAYDSEIDQAFIHLFRQ